MNQVDLRLAYSYHGGMSIPHISNIHPVSLERHQSKRWSFASDFHFAAGDHLVGLPIKELASAAVALPIAFINTGDSYRLVMLMGLKTGENLFVNTEGKWLARYLPERYRHYPFCLGETPEGRNVLCVDEGSGLVFEPTDSQMVDDRETFPFYSEEGESSTQLKAEKAAFDRMLEGQAFSSKIASFLNDNNLIKPWSITLRDGPDDHSSTPDRVVEGLYCINESAISKLSPERLIELRNLNGLWVVYGQMLSMRHLQGLGQLFLARHKQVRQEELVLETNAYRGSITFDNL